MQQAVSPDIKQQFDVHQGADQDPGLGSMRLRWVVAGVLLTTVAEASFLVSSASLCLAN